MPIISEYGINVILFLPSQVTHNLAMRLESPLFSAKEILPVNKPPNPLLFYGLKLKDEYEYKFE